MPAAVTCRAAPATGARQLVGPAAALPSQPLRALAAPRLSLPRRSAPLVVRAACEKSAAAVDSFARLANHFTKQLAAEYASSSGKEGNSNNGGHDSTFSKLESWLMGSNGNGEAADAPPSAPKATAADDDGSNITRMAKKAAQYAGVPTSVDGAVSYVKNWLSSPSQGQQGQQGSSNSSDGGSVQMVSRVMHRLLETYQQQSGQEFKGQPHEYDKLFDLAKLVLGSTLSKRVLKGLVRAYLRGAL